MICMSTDLRQARATGTSATFSFVINDGAPMGAGCSRNASTEVTSTPGVVRVKPPVAGADDAVPWAPDGNGNKAQEQEEVPTTPAPAPAPTLVVPRQPSESPESVENTAYGGSSRKLTILHFNDVYNIEEQTREPKGGAARLCAKIKEYRDSGVNPLVLFSGDCYNPSLMSTITLGKQMVPILNEIGVNVACIGNHDFDYGLDNLMKLNSQCKFPWLMANVLERGTDLPYAGAGTTWISHWNGVKVGVVGLVEEEWLETLGAVNVDDMQYTDFIATGRKMAHYLKRKGCELIIALTHMREPNDRKLCAEVGEFHLVLGGHDHHYVTDFIAPHNNLMVKSGTDFRDLSVIEVEFSEGRPDPAMSVERIVIDSSVPEDPATKEVVAEYMKLMGEKMDEPIGETLEPLDGRFQTVRNRESNLGNFVADVWRRCANAQIAILNSGSLRSDMIHPSGVLKAKDFVSILPMIDNTSVLECTGAQVVAALENSVSQWPKLEGRFPQVSGLKFKFDPSKPPGQRIVPGSVFVWEFEQEPEPLQLDRKYRVAVKEYLAQGKDGFTVFLDCKVLVDGESGVILPSTIKNHFIQLRVLNKWDEKKIYTRTLMARWVKRVKSVKSLENLADWQSKFQRTSAQYYQQRSHGLAVPHPEEGHYCIAPTIEGRIVNVLEEVVDLE